MEDVDDEDNMTSRDDGSVRRFCQNPITPSLNPSPSKSVPASPAPVAQKPEGIFHAPPTVEEATKALVDIKLLLRGQERQKPKEGPRSHAGVGYKDPDHNPRVRMHLEGMQALLSFYTHKDSKTYGGWAGSSYQAAIAFAQGRYAAKKLRKLTRQYIQDREILPINPYGDWNESMLVDEALVNEINLYLQEIGSANITARKVMEYVNRPEVMEKHGITHPISERTAHRFLYILGYRYHQPKKGQYADGHSRIDVVLYRQNIFLPKWHEFQQRMQSWTNEGLPEHGPCLPGRRVVAWFHDESIFYAHDRRKKSWFHKDAPATPYAKGDGASLMVADFVSADFGWLSSPNGTQSARVIFRPGKNRDGYFDCDDIVEQAQNAIAIIQQHYSEYDHVFAYNNATTHQKRPERAPSARKMPKFTPGPGKNWLLKVRSQTPDGKFVFNPDGSKATELVQMDDTAYNGQIQSLYFPPNHPRAGVFKGMVQILAERGIDTGNRRAECKNFHCPPGATECCVRRILYNQPDFAAVPSILETVFQHAGFELLFLPKFHCELNFIEQCWGYAKHIYRLHPTSSREDALETNTLNALNAVPLESMRRFDLSLDLSPLFSPMFQGLPTDPAGLWKPTS